MHLRRYLLLFVTLHGLIFLIPGCAEVPTDPVAKAEFDEVNDPLEPWNRTVFDVNDFLDRLLLRPLAELYRAMIPPGIRKRVTHIVSNLKEPVVFENNLLQGEFANAGTTLGRFGLNTTLGIGGIWDVAEPLAGLKQQSGDFGQTLYKWGVGEGYYVVLPLYGPSTTRDRVGMAVDLVSSPWFYLTLMDSPTTLMDYEAATIGTEALLKREQNIENLDALHRGSLDYYAQVRSAYRQRRARQLGAQCPSEAAKFEDDN